MLSYRRIFYCVLFLVGIFLLNTLLYFGLDLQDPAWHVDDVMHFLGGVSIALFFREYFRGQLKGLSNFNYLALIVACTMAVGVTWEWFEFLAQRIPSLQNIPIIGDLADTLTDLLNDTLGALVITSLHLLWRRQS